MMKRVKKTKKKFISDESKETIINGLMFVLGVFVLALTYNVLLEPNNFVIGSMTGLAIVCQSVFGWNATVFIYVSHILLLIVSFIVLDKQTSYNSVVGSILYPVMITITTPISNFILQYLQINELFIALGLTCILYGFACGLIYKAGFSTGGGDIIMQILSKYCNIKETDANFFYSIIIILASGFEFGMISVIYSVIILVASNLVIDKILIGISSSKVFYISSKKLGEIKKIIENEYDSGYTDLNMKSDLIHKRDEMIMVVIPNRSYYAFKMRILDIDPNAFITVMDCYEVNGGKVKENISFLEY